MDEGRLIHSIGLLRSREPILVLKTYILWSSESSTFSSKSAAAIVYTLSTTFSDLLRQKYYFIRKKVLLFPNNCEAPYGEKYYFFRSLPRFFFVAKQMITFIDTWLYMGTYIGQQLGQSV